MLYYLRTLPHTHVLLILVIHLICSTHLRFLRQRRQDTRNHRNLLPCLCHTHSSAKKYFYTPNAYKSHVCFFSLKSKNILHLYIVRFLSSILLYVILASPLSPEFEGRHSDPNTVLKPLWSSMRLYLLYTKRRKLLPYCVKLNRLLIPGFRPRRLYLKPF